MNLVAFVTVSGSVVVCVNCDTKTSQKCLNEYYQVLWYQHLKGLIFQEHLEEVEKDKQIFGLLLFSLLLILYCSVVVVLLAQHHCVNNQLTLEFEHALNGLERDFSF